MSSASTAVAAVIGPFHVLSYATLLGTQLYQTFIITKVAFTALPRTAFTTLQKRLFPIYFQSQSILLLLTLLSVPPLGPVTLLQNTSSWVSFCVAGVPALLNLITYGPRTQQAMIDRIHQATRDKQRDPGAIESEASDEMKACNRRFSRAHAMSIHLNLVSITATIYYGITLASRIRFAESA